MILAQVSYIFKEFFTESTTHFLEKSKNIISLRFFYILYKKNLSSTVSSMVVPRKKERHHISRLRVIIIMSSAKDIAIDTKRNFWDKNRLKLMVLVLTFNSKETRDTSQSKKIQEKFM